MKKKAAAPDKAASGARERKAGGMTFEQALQRLEEIVERLEGGEETLEDSLRLYEEAMSLWRFCDEQSRAAEERIKQLAGEPDKAEAEEPEETAEEE